MKRIAYNVEVNDNNIKEKMVENKDYIEKIIASIIYKRKERSCYEKSAIEAINIKKV